MAKHTRTGTALTEYNARRSAAKKAKPSTVKRIEVRAKKFPKKGAT